MILVTTNQVPGRPVVEVLGIAKGTSEITEMTKVIAECREQALDRMQLDAQRMGADAVIGLRFISTEVMASAAELLVYGTAVKLGEAGQET